MAARFYRCRCNNFHMKDHLSLNTSKGCKMIFSCFQRFIFCLSPFLMNILKVRFLQKGTEIPSGLSGNLTNEIFCVGSNPYFILCPLEKQRLVLMSEGKCLNIWGGCIKVFLFLSKWVCPPTSAKLSFCITEDDTKGSLRWICLANVTINTDHHGLILFCNIFLN